MIGQQQTVTGITGLKTTLQPGPDGTATTTTAATSENGIDKEMDEINNGASTTEAPKYNNPAGIEDGDIVKSYGGEEAGAGVVNGDDAAGKKEGDEEGEEEEPINMAFPFRDGFWKILLYIISFPIMAPLYLTLPDTKNKSSKFIL